MAGVLQTRSCIQAELLINFTFERQVMKQILKIFVVLQFFLALSIAFASETNVTRKLSVMDSPCLLLLRDTQYWTILPKGHDRQVWECEYGPSILSIVGLEYTSIGSSDDIVSGRTTLFIPDAEIIDGTLYIASNAEPEFGMLSEPSSRRLDTSPNGDKTVLVVRVVAPDAFTSNNDITLSDKVFGTRGDLVNLASQFKECSYNKLRFHPTHDSRTVAGVYTVSISQPVLGVANHLVRNAVTQKLSEEIGSLHTQFDFVMLCLPPGTDSTWIAYAYLNHYLSVYNDKWCTYVSAQMHEIGHNLGLGHSGEGSNAYADKSGMMGYSYALDDAPSMCFNGAKSWQLGWYNSRHSIADPLSASWNGRLVGSVDYANSFGHTVLLFIQGDASTNYYVAFNRRDTFNYNTGLGGDQVLVTTKSTSSTYAASSLVAKLNSGNTYTIPNFGGTGNDIIIRVNSINLNVSPAYADISVSNASTLAPTTLAPTTKPPTLAPVTPSPTTARPTPPPTMVDCSHYWYRNACGRMRHVCRWNRKRRICQNL